MQIAVIGAGIVGVTTAYELAADGHAVTVFERRPSVAAEASFANAGIVAPGWVAPWAAPGMPGKLLAGLWSRHSPVRFGAGTLAASPWLWRYLRACRKATHAQHRAALGRLAQFSRARMDDLAGSLKLEFEQALGYLVLLRSPRELTRAQKSLSHLVDLGIAHEVIDAARCRELEPALSTETPLQGAIRLPQDGVGNCRQFAHEIKARAQSLGASFRFGTEVRAITGGQRPELACRPVDSADAPVAEAFDAVVVCGGHESGRLLGPLGLPLPLLPVYGYSLTAQVRHLENGMDLGPRSGVMDERFQVTVTRLGQRVRVAGGAEIGGRPDRLDPDTLRSLYKVLKDWFPGAAELARVQQWKGARPMLPDGLPVIGPSPTKGVWLNLGHGSSGWALSCGSARVLADQIAGRTSGIDVSGLALERLG